MHVLKRKVGKVLFARGSRPSLGQATFEGYVRFQPPTIHDKNGRSADRRGPSFKAFDLSPRLALYIHWPWIFDAKRYTHLRAGYVEEDVSVIHEATTPQRVMTVWWQIAASTRFPIIYQASPPVRLFRTRLIETSRFSVRV